MYTSRVSVGSGHAQDQFTDHLYDPLRKTFHEDTSRKRNVLDEAARISKITGKLSPKNYTENQLLVNFP